MVKFKGKKIRIENYKSYGQTVQLLGLRMVVMGH